MTIKLPLSSIALLVAGLTVTGCASKQSWSPELEDARKALQQVRSDPLVSELALTELNKAQQQLQVAENASAYFKSAEVISHEASLATLAALEAQQTARAKAAKQNIRFAQATSQPPVMDSPATPVLAAALPATDSYASTTSGFESTTANYGSSQGDHTSFETPSIEAQQIAQQIAALSEQITQLQTRFESSAMQSANNSMYSQSYMQPATQAIAPPVVQTIAQSYVQPTAQPNTQTIESAPAVTAIQPITSTPLAYEEPAFAPIIAEPIYDGYTTTALAEPYLAAALAESSSAAAIAEPSLAAAIAGPSTTEMQPLTDEYFSANDSFTNESLQAELLAMNAQPSNRGMSLTLGDRYFEADSARMWNGRAARHLDNIATVMSENPALDIEIEAHTDNTGDAEFRHNLSTDRAIAIKSALVLRGISTGRIISTGYGDQSPIASNDTELGQMQNSRVEIIFPDFAQ